MASRSSLLIVRLQHEHISVVKALYDYDAANPGELTVKEDEILHVYDKDDAWLLVHSQKPGGRVGFVPETYVEEARLNFISLLLLGHALIDCGRQIGEGSESAPPAVPTISSIVVPPSVSPTQPSRQHIMTIHLHNIPAATASQYLRRPCGPRRCHL